MKSMASFIGTRGEDTLCHIPGMVKTEGGPPVSMMLNAIAAAEDANPLFVTRALKLVSHKCPHEPTFEVT